MLKIKSDGTLCFKLDSTESIAVMSLPVAEWFCISNLSLGRCSYHRMVYDADRCLMFKVESDHITCPGACEVRRAKVQLTQSLRYGNTWALLKCSTTGDWARVNDLPSRINLTFRKYNTPSVLQKVSSAITRSYAHYLMTHWTKDELRDMNSVVTKTHHIVRYSSGTERLMI